MGGLLGLFFLIISQDLLYGKECLCTTKECLEGLSKIPKDWVYWDVEDFSGDSRPPNSKKEKREGLNM